MKRVKLLPADIEKIDSLIPHRLSDSDLANFRVTIAGYEFLTIGGVLLCPQCGQPQKLECQVALDQAVYFFLKFYCAHYAPSLTATLPETSQSQ
jgi:hypothetical protein